MKLFRDYYAGLDVLGGVYLGDDAEPAKRQGTARDFGLLDMAFACIVGAHLTAKQALEDYARQLSGQILNQTTPIVTAGTFRKQLEALAVEIKKITNRNPLDEVYSGPKFPQSQNDYFSGKGGATIASHAMEEAVPDIKQKFDDATKGLKNAGKWLKWGAVGVGGIAALGLGLGIYSHVRAR